MMALWHQGDAYAIQDEDEDSSEVSSSSEDEIDIILHGTPEQKRKLKRLHNKNAADRIDERRTISIRDQPSSSEDEFEKEMNAELAQHVKNLESKRDETFSGTQSTNKGSNKKAEKDKSQNDIFYDDIYFDSDEDENDDGICPQGSRKHGVISNDDLLYDPTMDDKDQRWVDKQRCRNNNSAFDRLMGQTQNKNKKPAKIPTSDALLDCPACLTTLCIDCQRHDTYRHQYRAMFVMNCQVDRTQMLQCPEQQAKGKKKKKKNMDEDQSMTVDSGTGPSSDLFHSVKCTECSTVVGVIDTDEVYHFFNILASHT